MVLYGQETMLYDQGISFEFGRKDGKKLKLFEKGACQGGSNEQ